MSQSENILRSRFPRSSSPEPCLPPHTSLPIMSTNDNSGRAATLSGFGLSGLPKSTGSTLRDVFSWPERLTLRSLVVGLIVGSILCASNTFFGLQTGWVTMGSLQSALLGYGIFRIGANLRSPWNLRFLGFSQEENVVLQTTAVATATMPLAAGLVGIIPAFNLLTDADTGGRPVHLTSFGSLLIWSFALAFFGVFIAIPLRRQVILKEKLRFPSGTATARVIRVLHLNPMTNASHPAVPATLSDVAAAPTAETSTAIDAERAELLRGGGGGDDGSRARSHALPKDTDSLVGGEDGGPSHGGEHGPAPDPASVQDFARSWFNLLVTFIGSGIYTFLQAALPMAFPKSWPIFGSRAKAWGWEIQVSSGYVGQGMIMGPRVTLSMLGGAILGWAILGPMARRKGWAPGPIGSWERGATGWVLWVSLAIMLGDSLTSLAVLIVGQALRRRMDSAANAAPGTAAVAADAGSDKLSHVDGEGDVSSSRRLDEASKLPGDADAAAISIQDEPSAPAAQELDESDPKAQLRRRSPTAATHPDANHESDGPVAATLAPERDPPRALWLGGAILSTLLGSVILTVMFKAHHVSFFHPLAAFVFSIFVAILAVRALGETDLNPVSGVGKLSQLLFGLIAPGNVVVNLVAGAIAEAGAMQAGDLMQDFKTAHLLGVCPRAQIVGQLIGSLCSVFVAVLSYKLYASQSVIGGEEFPAPTAGIWVSMARLANGGKLMTGVKGFAIGGFVLSCVNQLLIDVAHNESIRRFLATLPSSVLGGYVPRVLSVLDRAAPYLPSGIGVAVGLYVAPRWTLPRLIGSVIELGWRYADARSHKQFMLVVASGLVLGEGTASILVAACKAIFGL